MKSGVQRFLGRLFRYIPVTSTLKRAMRRNDITGFILAGGRSRRMGQDKSQIPWDSGTLLTHAVEVLNEVVSSVFIVGVLQARNSPVPVLPDNYPDCGPLAGIQAALAHTKTAWNMVLAVDLPLVTSALLSFIAQEHDRSQAAVVPQVGGRLQPLCAAYHRKLLPEIQNAIDESNRSIHRLLERLNAGIMKEKVGSIRVLGEREIIAQGFPPEMLVNVNTPEDLERARSIARNLHV